MLIHPVHTDFGWDVDKSRVVNRKTGRVHNDKNRKRQRWYKNAKIGGKFTYEHIFLYECFHQVDATGTEIDHINNDHEDDRVQNLQRLTKRDHKRKTTASKEGETAKKIARTQGRPGVARNPTTGKEVKFESINDLANKIGNSHSNVHRFLRDPTSSPPSGFAEIRFDTPKSIDGEVWRTHPTLSYLSISNHGRVCNRGRVTDGTTNVAGYKEYSGKRVHVLVAEAFLRPKPSAKHSVDHVDRDRTNNHISNLRWATNSEQVMNQSNKRHYVQVNGFTGEVINRFTHKEGVSALGTCSKVFTSVSGKREWFTFFDKETLRARRIDFVRKRLAMTRGMALKGRWSTVASGFFKNRDKYIQISPSSCVDMASFVNEQVAANCIKFHIKSWMCFSKVDAMTGYFS